MHQLLAALLIFISILGCKPKEDHNYSTLKENFEYYEKNNIDSLLIFSLSLNKNNDKIDPTLMGLKSYYIGRYYSKKGFNDKALEKYFESEDYFKKSNNSVMLSKSYSMIGAVYRHLKDYKKSVEYFKMSYQYSSSNDSIVRATILNRIGDMHRDLDNIDSSFYYYHQSLNLCGPKDSSIIANNLNNLADLFTTKLMFDSAYYYYNKSISYLDSTGIVSEIAENYTSLAELKMLQNNYDDAISYIEKSIKILESNEANYELNNAYQKAISIYKKVGLKDSVIVYLEKLSDLENNASKEKLKQGLTALEMELSLNDLQTISEFNKKINYLLIAIVVLVMLMGVMLWFQIRRKKAENLILSKQKEEIEKAKIELEHAYHDIHDLNATKDKFFSIIAHDLRNPLGSFKEITRLLHESYDDFSEDDRKEFLEMLKHSSENIHSLLENLLEWSRTQRGTLDFNPVRFNLRDIVENTISLHRINADTKSIHINNDVSPDTFLIADPNLMTTVIRNLISNAIKFTPEKGIITIESFAEPESINIFVNDNGIGMTSDIIDKLFRIDVNVTTLGTSKEKGTGLGLILCKEFVERHGGNIWAESKPGEGSKFKIRLPKIEHNEDVAH